MTSCDIYATILSYMTCNTTYYVIEHVWHPRTLYACDMYDTTSALSISFQTTYMFTNTCCREPKQKHFEQCFPVFRLLSGITINSVESAKLAMQKLHDMGAKTVIISSSDIGPPDTLIGFGSSVASKPHFYMFFQTSVKFYFWIVTGFTNVRQRRKTQTAKIL